MPEFVMPIGSAETDARFCQASDFLRGYLEAAFFTSAGCAEDDDLEDAELSELSEEAWTQAQTDCATFLATLPLDGHGRTWLDLATDYASDGYTDEQAGRDFWFTRNGHGVGFWDRGLGAAGDRLSDHARAFGDVSLYRGDDGALYFT